MSILLPNINNDAQIGIELTEDKNLHYSIGHGTILNPAIDKNGNFNCLLFDKYDFYIDSGKNSTWNNEADAFKHAFMQARTTVVYGASIS